MIDIALCTGARLRDSGDTTDKPLTGTRNLDVSVQVRECVTSSSGVAGTFRGTTGTFRFPKAKAEICVSLWTVACCAYVSRLPVSCHDIESV